MNAITEIQKARDTIDKTYETIDHIADERIPKKTELLTELQESSLMMDNIEKRLTPKKE